MDLAIINGHVYVEGKFLDTNIYIKNEKIVKISNETLEAANTIDAGGLWVLPGLIDPHVHLKLEVNGKYSRDDFHTGTVLAAYGGVTTIIDFLSPKQSLEEVKSAYKERLTDASCSFVDYGFHVTIADYFDDIGGLMAWCNEQGMPSIKLFTTYASSNRQTPDSTINKLFKHSKANNVRILCHCENNQMIDESKGGLVKEHESRRPAISEISEVIKLAEMTKYYDALTYIVHLNCGTTLESLSNNYSKLLDSNQFVVESCPHYLLLNKEVYNTSEGYRYVMTPPLRSENERKKLVNHMKYINVIGTDHCPYNESEKNQPTLDNLPNGIEGMPYTLPSLFKVFGEKIIDKLTVDVAKIHGMYPAKGIIREGSDGDIILFDPSFEWKVKGSEPWYKYLSRNCMETPYKNIPMKGIVKTTISRGEPIMDEGTILPHKGKYIQRGPWK